MKKDILVSVIIPVYNAEKVLGTAIRSILKQTYPKWELILMDDGSTDRSSFVCRDFEKQDKRVKYFYQSNQGALHTRLNGIKHCAGDFIMFCDADDKLDRNMLKEMAQISDQYDADIVFCNHFLMSRHGFISKGKPQSGQVRVFQGKLLAGSFSGGNLVSPEMWGKLYKRELFERNIAQLEALPKVFVGDDTMMNSILFYSAGTVIGVEKNLYYYRVGGGSSRYSDAILDDVVAVYHWRKRFLLETGNESWQPCNLAQVLNWIIYFYQFRNESFSMDEFAGKLESVIGDVPSYGRDYFYRDMFLNVRKMQWEEFCGLYREKAVVRLKQLVLEVL